MKKLFILLLLTACPLFGQFNFDLLDDYGGYTYPWDINEANVIVGQSGGFAVKWDNNQIEMLDGISPEEHVAVAINNLDQIVGCGWTETGYIHAVLWTDDIPIDLGVLMPDGWSMAYDINDSGLVIGWATDETSTPRAVLWDTEVSTALIDLGSLVTDGWSEAFGINGSGQIVGKAMNSIGRITAFVITPDGDVWNRDDDLDGTNDLMYEIIIPDTINSEAYEINSAGEIIGDMNTNTGQWRGLLWTFLDGMTDLGDMGGTETHTLDINGDCVIVGYVTTPIRNIGFHWNETISGFNDYTEEQRNWYIERATAINDDGRIVGMAKSGIERRAFELQPTDGPPILPEEVPENYPQAEINNSQQLDQ